MQNPRNQLTIHDITPEKGKQQYKHNTTSRPDTRRHAHALDEAIGGEMRKKHELTG
jgi:hypothetical protein